MANVTTPTESTLPVAGGDIIAAPLSGWITNLKNFVEGANIDENNVDYTSFDGIVVKAQTQTLSGAKTFSSAITASAGLITGGVIISDTDSTDDLGSTSKRFANLYVDSIGDTGQDLTIAATTTNLPSGHITDYNSADVTITHAANTLTIAGGNTVVDSLTSGGNIVSDTDSTDDLGTTGVRWANLFVDDVTVTNNVTIGGTLTLTGGITLNGNTTIGDSSADTLTVNSTITSNLIFTDATYDIGASGATRPRDLFLSRNAVMGGTLGVTGLITATGGVSGALTGNVTGDLSGNVTGGTISGTTGTFSGAVNANNLVLDASGNYPILLENQAGTTADAAISTFDDANGTLLALGSNFYFSSGGAETRFNTSEEAAGIVLNRTGTISLRTSDGSNNTVERVSVGNTGDFAVNTSQLFVDQSASRVGINTVSPTEELDIEGSGATQTIRLIRTDASTAGGITINSANGSNYVYNTAAKDLVLSADNGATQTKLHSNGDFSVNTSQLFVDASASAVGVGTSSPSGLGQRSLNVKAPASSGADLTIEADNGNNFGVFFSGATTNDPFSIYSNTGFKFATASDKNATGFVERFRLSADGNAGLGSTATNAYNSAHRALELGSRGANIAGRTDSDTIYVNANAYQHTDGNWKYDSTDEASQYYQTGGTHNWRRAASGTAGTNITWTTQAVLDASGIMGLGVTPTSGWSGRTALEIEGASTGYVTSPNGPIAIGSNIYYNGGDKFVGNGYAPLYALSSGNHIWYTSNNNTSGAGAAVTLTQAMTLLSTGNLGIGSVSPSTKLHVSGASSASALRLDETTSSANSYLGYIDTSGNFGIDVNGGGYLRFAVGGAERARITSAGNLTLQTNQAADTALAIYNTSSSASAKASLKVGYDSGNHLHIYRQGNLAGIFYNATQSGSSHQFQIAGSAKATLDASGNFGLGTVSPVALSNQTSLTINGTSVGRVDVKAGGGGGGVMFGTSSALTVQANSGVAVNLDSASGQPITFQVGSSEKARILSSGGITFNGDTAAANALDDYEEGTWTPTIDGFTGTYGQNSGTYVKIGQLVHASCYITISSLTSMDGTPLDVSGFPFAAENSTSVWYAGNFGNFGFLDLPTGTVDVAWNIGNGLTTSTCRAMKDNADYENVLNTAITSTSFFMYVSWTYRTA